MFELNRILMKNFIKVYSYKIASSTATYANRVAERPYERIDTVNLAYTYYGTDDGFNTTKPPLVTIHGLMGSKNNFNSFAKPIKEGSGRKVLGIDVRNHGHSEHSSKHTYIHIAYDIINLLEKLDIPKVAVLGHSMGGRVAIVLALLCPELVSSMAVIDMLPVRTNPKIFGMVGMLDAMSSVVFKPGMTVAEAMETADEELKKVTMDINVRNYILENIVQTSTGSYTWTLNTPVLKETFTGEMARFPLSLMNSRYHGPSLIIAGSQSDFVRKSDIPEIRKFFPSGEVTYIQDAGHCLHMQKPEAFLKVLCKFLNEY